MTKILVVDDERAMSRGLSRAILLRRPDYSVLTAPSGSEAMLLLEEQHVDLVVTDLQMPDGDGFQLLAWLVSHRPSVLSFAMSGFCDEEAQARLIRLGSIECFSKPLDIDLLLKRLNECLTASMRGQVANVGLASFLQLIELEQKTCTLEVRHQHRTGHLYMRRGELIDARTAELRGESAAYAIIGWLTVDLTIESSCNTAERTVWKPTHFVVMEAMRISDEDALARGARENEQPSSKSSDPFAEKPTSEHMTLQSLTQAVRSLERFPAPLGALTLALIDLETGLVVASHGSMRAEVAELARSSHALARKQNATLALASSSGELLEELVVMTRSRGELLRPMPDGKQLVLLVFDVEQTNVVMARHELARWIVDYTSADKS